MKINFDQVLKHAEERLAKQTLKDSAEWVSLFKTFLKVEDHRLFMHHRYGISGIEVAKNRSLMIDVLLKHAYQLLLHNLNNHESEPGLTLIALGGYGRGMLNPHSDIDLMFLMDKKMRPQAEPVIKKLLYLLWDIGLKVGHSARTISEAISESKNDLDTRTSIMESRFITGNPLLHQKFCEQFSKYCKSANKENYVREKLEELKNRHHRYRDTVYLLEPHIKEGMGGLRDFFLVQWVYQWVHGYKSFAELRDNGIYSPKEYKTLMHALDFLMRIRNELHFLTQKPFDILTLSLQPKMAKNLDIKKEKILGPSEALMKHYYTHARNIAYLSRMALERKEIHTQLKFSFPKRFIKRQGFSFTESEIEPGMDPELFKKDPYKLLEIFLFCAQGKYRLSYALLNQVRNHLYLVDKKFQTSPKALQDFLNLITFKGPIIKSLRAMHECGLLDKYIPEFGKCTCFVIHDMYHVFTLDEHTLKAIEFLDELKTTEEANLKLFASVYQNIKDPDVAFFAVFLHDIGKTRGKGHAQKGGVMVQEILARMGYPQAKIDRVRLLVEQHLTMVHISQRRDLSEEKVIQKFAEKIKDVENLRILHLVTMVDSRATSDKVWSDWKETLLWELYLKTKQYLEKGVALLPSEIKQKQDTLVEDLKRLGFDSNEVTNHINLLPFSYLQAFSFSSVGEHIKIIQQMNKHDPAFFWHYNEKNNTTEMTICTHDRRGFFSDMTGILAGQRVNILSAEIYTRKDGIIIDRFTLENTYEKSILNLRIQQNIMKQFQDLSNTPVESILKNKIPQKNMEPPQNPPMVRYDLKTSDTSTIIEIQADDEVGLLFKISHTLLGLNASILHSIIATEKAQAFDVFYIQDENNQKITNPAFLHHIETELVQALSVSIEELLPN